MNGLIFVDCEADGPCPGIGSLTEFGAVSYDLWKIDPNPAHCAFHGQLWYAKPDPYNPAVSRIDRSIMQPSSHDRRSVMVEFDSWLRELGQNRVVFVSDNPAYDFQWINYAFWTSGIANPFGHSARSIKDFYAGLAGNFLNSQNWKKLRVTPHDHNPVHDALGNVEAFDRMLKGER